MTKKTESCILHLLHPSSMPDHVFEVTEKRAKRNIMISLRLDLRTFCVLDRRDNQLFFVLDIDSRAVDVMCLLTYTMKPV